MKFVQCLIFGICVIQITLSTACASVLINEFLADPPTGILGDANGDGTTSSRDDEFVEIVNFGFDCVDISGWTINDRIGLRHSFSLGTLLDPYECIVVFGGGHPASFDFKTAVASKGQLHLNNDGDSITLFDAYHNLIDQVIYGVKGGEDQSLSRFPDGSGQWMLHSKIPGSNGRIYSPGRQVDGQPFSVPVVPESSTVLLLGFGFAGLIFKNKLFRLSNKQSYPPSLRSASELRRDVTRCSLVDIRG